VQAFFVTKRLAFGSEITTWRSAEKLQALCITHVMNVLGDKHGKKIRQFENVCLSFRDDMKPRPRWFYRHALTFYNRAMCKPNAKMFVMCRLGICRSASMTYFLLRASGYGKARAQNVVLRARPDDSKNLPRMWRALLGAPGKIKELSKSARRWMVPWVDQTEPRVALLEAAIKAEILFSSREKYRRKGQKRNSLD